MIKNKKISIVLPAYNEEENIDLLYERIIAVCKKADINYELVFVDSGSTDTSLDMIKRLREKDPKVEYISLSRNFGHQAALVAGMSHASGDAVISMDADLQHPPEVIPEMVELWEKGIEVVYTTKNAASDIGRIDRFIFKMFYRLISKISALNLSFGQSDFRLLDRKALDAILSMPEYHKFLRGQTEWIGFNQQGITYNVERRHGGISKFSYKNRFSFALDGIFGFSRYPLHVLMMLGLGIAIASFLYIIFAITMWVLNIFNIFTLQAIPPGWLTLAVMIFFLGSVQLIAIGILGEYVGRTFDQTKSRPVYIVRESSLEKK